MFRFIIFLVLVIFLFIQLGWVVITPNVYQDFRKIKSFFSELISSSELDKLKGNRGRNYNITDLTKEKNLELHRKSGKQAVKTTGILGKIRHQVEDISFWDDIKSIYSGFFSNQ